MGVPAPAQEPNQDSRGQAWEGHRDVLVNQASSHHPMAMCCVAPAALADFSAAGVWCFPTLMATGWGLDRGEEGGARQEGGCEEEQKNNSSVVHEAQMKPTSPSRVAEQGRGGVSVPSWESHTCALLPGKSSMFAEQVGSASVVY